MKTYRLSRKEIKNYDLIRLKPHFVFVYGGYFDLKNFKQIQDKSKELVIENILINDLPLEATLFDAHKGVYLSRVIIFDYYTYGKLQNAYDVPMSISDFVLKSLNSLINGSCEPKSLLNPLGGKQKKRFNPQVKNNIGSLIQMMEFIRTGYKNVNDNKQLSKNKILELLSKKYPMEKFPDERAYFYNVSKQALEKDLKKLDTRANRINNVQALLDILYIRNPDNDKDIKTRCELAKEKINQIYSPEKITSYL